MWDLKASIQNFGTWKSVSVQSGCSANPKAQKLSCWMLLPTFPTVSLFSMIYLCLFSAAQAAFQVLSGPVGRWCQDHFGGPFGAAHAARCESWGRPPVGSSLAQRWSFGIETPKFYPFLGCNVGCHAMVTWCTPLILGQTQVGAEVWPNPSTDFWWFLIIPIYSLSCNSDVGT